MAGSSEIESEGKKEGKKPPVDDVLYPSWDIDLSIDSNNNGHIILTVRGIVNKGRLRDVSLSIFSDADVDFDGLNLVVKDLDTGEEIIPEPILLDKKFKRIKIPFKYPIDKGEEFGYEAKYILPGSFKAIGEDYYSHRSVLNKEMSLSIKFPEDVKVESIDDSHIKSTGGIVRELSEDEKPKISEDRNQIKWVITDTPIGYTYILKWRTVRVTNKEN
jgi:hypothetical protein